MHQNRIRNLFSLSLVILLMTSPAFALPPSSEKEAPFDYRYHLKEERQLRFGFAKSNFSSAASILGRLKEPICREEITEAFSPEDFDGDGLSDELEATYQTDPKNPDTDCDALYDGWEVREYNGVNLKALGANPRQKDIFVQMDYMSDRYYPSEKVLETIVSVFQSAPVSNPDGSSGINLHLIKGEKIPLIKILKGSNSSLDALREKHFPPERRSMFHYAIWGNRYSYKSRGKKITNSSGFSKGIPGSSFFLALGHFPYHGTTPVKVGTFLHELGHNLGLRHGGVDDTNRKPNHLSIMSYTHQFRGLRKGKRYGNFDYQRHPTRDLNEKDLDETKPLSSLPAWKDFYAIYDVPDSDKDVAFLVKDGFDYSRDGKKKTSVQSDINHDGEIKTLRAEFIEWERIVFHGGAIGTPFDHNKSLNSERLLLFQAPTIFEPTLTDAEKDGLFRTDLEVEE